MKERLISADGLIELCNIMADKCDGIETSIWHQFATTVEWSPTVDAVPLEDYKSMEQTVHKLTSAIANIVKHGRWEYEGMIDHTWKVFTCTECGKQCIGGGKYCPNCGARMEEENDL